MQAGTTIVTITVQETIRITGLIRPDVRTISEDGLITTTTILLTGASARAGVRLLQVLVIIVLEVVVQAAVSVAEALAEATQAAALAEAISVVVEDK